MNEVEIKNLLACVKNVHVCAKNELKFRKKFPSFYVINTEQRIYNKTTSGEHWIGLIFDIVNNQTTCYIFDSLAAYPAVVCSEIFQFAQNNSSVLRVNGRRVQSPYNKTCGLHVCKFVLAYRKKFNYRIFLMSFSASERENDVAVLNLFGRSLQVDPFGGESVKIMHCQSIKALASF
jgi:Ulp1 protease family, C-terminal catalytic domain